MDRLTNQDRENAIQRILSGEMSEKEQTELLNILEADKFEEALQDYPVFAEQYIKIVDKEGNLVPLKHNSIQTRINLKKKELRAQKKLVRVIVIKPRQCGVSTDAQGNMISHTATKEHRTGLIVAHTQPASTVILEKARYMYNNLPPHVKPLIQASNAKELVFDRPTGYKGKGKGLHSKISIQVAGDVNIGRGDTIHYFHGSEMAFWPAPDGKGIKKQLAGIMAAMPKTLDTDAEIESTANGFNEFKDLCDDAMAGKNEWTLLFFAWHDFELNVMDCTNEEYNKLLSSIDDKEVKEYLLGADGQPGIIKTFNLTKEQVKWWIWTYRNDNNGDLDMMHQENPSSYNEAFISSGKPIFNNAKVNSRIEILRKKYKENPPKQGYFYFEWEDPDKEDRIKEKSIKWVDDPNGYITLYEPPMAGYPYVIGGDTKGESTNSDMYAGAVINNVTGNRAAAIHGQWASSKPYTWQMYCMGMYYNLALIGIEMNWNTAPIEELERLHYPRQYLRKRYDDASGEFKDAYGWKTDGNTRPLIIDKEVHLINKNTGLFNDITMLNECITFIRKDGRPDAMSGKHDDALFADMIAAEIRRHQSFEAEPEREREPRGNFDNDMEHSGGRCVSPYD